MSEVIMEHTDPVLKIEHLFVETTGRRPAPILNGISLEIGSGETVCLVGESGSGKSVTSLATMGLLPKSALVARQGRILLEGEDLLRASSARLKELRATRMSMIFQEPMTALNPVLTVGRQIEEVLQAHSSLGAQEQRRRVLNMMEHVHLPDVERIYRSYPHQLSGGQRQRIMIAMALILRPKLLIADEPTTALDVTVQAEILNLLRRLQEQSGMSVLMITHDWGVVADLCQRAYVMYAGQVVESAPVVDLFDAPKHPYTVALLNSTPQPENRGRPLTAVPGTVPPPGTWQSGCRFAPRCPIATPECSAGSILMTTITTSQRARCIHTDRVRKETASERPNAAQGA